MRPDNIGLVSHHFSYFFFSLDFQQLCVFLCVLLCTYFYLSFRCVRVELIAGFVNGLFLLFVSFFIFAESFEVNICS